MSERTIQDFARELAVKLERYLAIGLSANDIEWVIVEAMQTEHASFWCSETEMGS